ncbi:MAG: hypothetical protein ACR2MP_01440 [Streptosporangiaceae bacterium]
MRLLSGRDGPAALATGRRGKGTGLGFFLIGAGAILLFAVPTGSWAGLNLHIAGLIVLIVGVLRLVLLVQRGVPRPGRLRRIVNPSGVDDPGVGDVRTAAVIVAERIWEDEKSFRAAGDGREHDEL